MKMVEEDSFPTTSIEGEEQPIMNPVSQNESGIFYAIN